MSKKDILSQRIETPKSMTVSGSINKPVRYNRKSMVEENVKTIREGFSGRLAELRMHRDVSAREMSISLGQGAGYVNNIENGYALPSIEMLFAICDYLEVSPMTFFSYTDNVDTIIEPLSRLGNEERKVIEKLIEMMGR